MTSNTSNYCKERQLFFTYISALPKVRTETVSPYPSFTQEQLNMRRKVEILKYANQTSSLGGKYTKNQKWAMINKKKTSRYQNLISCPKRIQPTPTSSCDVPGPVIYLLEDDSVPLYKYATVQNYQLPIIPDAASEYKVDWTSNQDNNIQSSSTIPFTVSTIATVSINDNTTLFQFQSPISLSIIGNKNTLAKATKVQKICVQISEISYLTKYMDSPVIIYGSPPIVNTYDMVNSSMIIDISNSNVGYFSASQYINNIIVSNINLQTQIGYLYHMTLNFTLKYYLYDKNNTLITGASNTDSINLYSIANLTDITDPYYNYSDNCALTTTPYSPFIPFTLTGK